MNKKYYNNIYQLNEKIEKMRKDLELKKCKYRWNVNESRFDELLSTILMINQIKWINF